MEERRFTLMDLLKDIIAIVLIFVSIVGIVLGVLHTINYNKSVSKKQEICNAASSYIRSELVYCTDVRFEKESPGESWHSLKIDQHGFLYKDNKRVLKDIINDDNRLSVKVKAFDLTNSRIDLSYVLEFDDDDYKKRDTIKLLNLNVSHKDAKKQTDRFVGYKLNDTKKTLYYLK